MCEPNPTTNENKVQASKFKNIKDNILFGPEYPISREPVNIAKIILKTLKSKPEFIGQIDALTGKQNTYAEMSERSIKCALWLKKQGVKAARARYYLSLISPTIIFTIPLSAANLTEAAKELKMDVKIVVLGKIDGYESLDNILRGHDNREIAEFNCTPISNLNEVGLICLSSGTTGMPKATELSHVSMYNRVFPAKVYEMNGHICLFLPTLRWHYGILFAFAAIQKYFTTILVNINVNDENRCSKYCSFIERYRVTFFGSTPHILSQLVKTDVLEKYRLPTLKVITSGGSTFSKQQQEALKKKIPNVLIFNSYGSTDAGCAVAIQNKYSKLGSVGFPASNVQIKITDTKTESVLGVNKVGEIRVKTPFVMNGYYKNPEATKKAFDSDGWLCTGDLGYYDHDGELFVVSRISDFILFRTFNVLPMEIETVLQDHPAVFEAVVIGMPHEDDGQRPMAVVSVVPGKTVTEQELIELVEKSLPDYCRLRAGIKFIDKLPRTLTGKIAKGQLQSMFTN
ncbi:4-coumarate--CoA ligase 1 isoform X2 [Monomorium pharaonis]|uniref:4-coumarate--CoA ligase 1 isoform X2 n=1 Tax=Monomorium pharaonis TaxID=307658 RepID=UPI001746DA42|nr:4-coumarate--CoA ligase 1 isoform X2 [Monomorium pharaonis]